MAEKNSPEVKCPQCSKRGNWFDDQWGPFCSRKCKLVDLGQWLDEEHKIESELKPDHFEGYENLPPGNYLDNPES